MKGAVAEGGACESDDCKEVEWMSSETGDRAVVLSLSIVTLLFCLKVKP